ncbi:MAG: glycosyltransferase family 2 protein [candidate division Zixibacteria bacterium]|nr:glycosyltransferase family 2 protein [candidate division Zixibacteria bacterium]
MNEHRPGTDRVEVTVVVPGHNEQDNVAPLLDQFGELSRRARFTMEVVFVDDGSTDQTLPRVVDAQTRHRFVRIVALPSRRGLTEALRAGFSVARGEILVFYPADRQFHPADIPRLVEKVRGGFDLVTGRKIGQYSKRFVSGFYNRLSRLLFPSIQVSDLNSVKAFRRELIDVFDYRHDWHRFWVAIVSEAGYRVGEVDVTLYDRGAGKSKYGLWRIPGGILDLLAVKFQLHTMRRPLRYFGTIGMALLLGAVLVGLIAVYERFVLGHGFRPLLYLVMTLSLSGMLLFAIGFLAEALAGVRQQVDALHPTPKYQIYRATSQVRFPHAVSPPPGRPERPERPEHGSADRPERRREGRGGRDGSRRGRPGPDRPPRTHDRTPSTTHAAVGSAGGGGTTPQEPAEPLPAAPKEQRMDVSLPYAIPEVPPRVSESRPAPADLESPLELPLRPRTEPLPAPKPLPPDPIMTPADESPSEPPVPSNEPERRDMYGRRRRP